MVPRVHAWSRSQVFRKVFPFGMIGPDPTQMRAALDNVLTLVDGAILRDSCRYMNVEVAKSRAVPPISSSENLR